MFETFERVAKIREEIREAALRAGRDPAQITIVAVTKTYPPEKITPVVKAGINTLGENRVQELLDKVPLLSKEIKWHLIGHLQTNKVKYIIDKVELIHSLDRFSLAQELNRRGEQAGLVINSLVQVNVAGEDTKFGLAPSEVREFIEEISALPYVRVKGLMTIAPLVDNPEEVRPVFRELRLMAEGFRSLSLRGFSGEFLSMGMSNDYVVAVEEGANLVRIGSRIFGARNY